MLFRSALLAILALTPWRGQRRRGAGTEAQAADLRPARRWLARMERELAKNGLPRSPTETLEAYAASLQRRGSLPEALAIAFVAYQDVRFGGHPLDATRLSRLEQGLAAAQQCFAPMRSTTN